MYLLLLELTGLFGFSGVTVTRHTIARWDPFSTISIGGRGINIRLERGRRTHPCLCREGSVTPIVCEKSKFLQGPPPSSCTSGALARSDDVPVVHEDGTCCVGITVGITIRI